MTESAQWIFGIFDINILELAGIRNQGEVFHRIYVSLPDKGLNKVFADFFNVYISLSSSDKIWKTA